MCYNETFCVIIGPVAAMHETLCSNESPYNEIFGLIIHSPVMVSSSWISLETSIPPDWLLTIAHDDVIKWKHFPRYWPFVRGIHRSPVNSPHKGQWRGALMFSLICVWINSWVNNREAGDLRRYRAHYDINVMYHRGMLAHRRHNWNHQHWSYVPFVDKSIVSLYNCNGHVWVVVRVVERLMYCCIDKTDGICGHDDQSGLSSSIITWHRWLHFTIDPFC